MIRVERCLYKDASYVTNSEVKTQEFPLTLDEITPYIQDKGKEAYLAKVGNRAVGHAIVIFEKEETVCRLVSIGVDTKFRRVGVARKIIKKIIVDADVEGCSSVSILVPSYQIDDKEDPWNIEHWLWRMEFKAVGTRGVCRRYCKDYDWYVFERKIR